MHVLNFPDRHAVLRADLAAMRERAPDIVEGMSPRQYAHRVATELSHYWREVLEPMWEELEAIAAEDIAYHSRRMSREGVARALDGVHEAISYDDGVLTVDVRQTDQRVQPSEAGVWLVPSAFRWPWIAARFDGPVVVSYAARGAARVWESDPAAAVDDALAALLGRSRAAILQSLSLPRSTTRLARDLGLSAGTVSEHLSVMTSSGLLTARREGRRVLYSQTSLGADLANGGPQAWHTAGSTSA
jgi:DNA-binding transcriptional ArsR family regulator